MNFSPESLPKLPNGYAPNDDQANVARWVKEGTGNAVLNAVAGSGKTSTLVWLAEHFLTGNGLFVAFNRIIAKELGNRLKGTDMIAKTIHSVGMGMLRSAFGNLDVDTYGKKYDEIVDRIVDEANLPDEEMEETARNLRKLIDLARLTLTNPNDEAALEDLMVRFDLPVNGYHLFLPQALAEGNTLAKKRGWIDFTDMIYMPVVLKLKAPTFKWVLVDECQDLNAAQLAIVMKCKASSGRMLFVGDRRQAIYGFAGADARAFDKIIERANAHELPLSVCYRCPVKVLDIARKVGTDHIGTAIVPQIKPGPGADAGTVERKAEDKLLELANTGDMVLSRTNAPLIKWCIRFIQNRKAASVRGRDIGKMLTSILAYVERMPGYSFPEIITFVEKYRASKIAYLDRKDADQSAYESLNDRVDCVIACIEGFMADDILELKREIEALFDNNDEGVIFTSVHRAKGLENDRIFILEPSKLPLKWENQQRWQLEQELNLEYVAVTRTMRELIYLD